MQRGLLLRQFCRTTGRATAHHQPSCRPERHLLPPADRLPVATVATRICSVWHGLPLLSSLAKLRCVGPSTSSALRAGPILHSGFGAKCGAPHFAPLEWSRNLSRSAPSLSDRERSK